MKHYIMAVDDDTYTISLYDMIARWTPDKSYFTTEMNADKALDTLDNIYQNSPEKFPDYILLDLRMPEMDGFEFIRKFEKNFPQRKNKTFFIITTSSIIDKDKKEAFDFDCVLDFVIKPISPDFINKLITQGHHHSLMSNIT